MQLAKKAKGVNTHCEEISYIKNVTPYEIKIIIEKYLVNIQSIACEYDKDISLESRSILRLSQMQSQVDQLNRNLKDLGFLCAAELTDMNKRYKKS